MLFKSQQNKGIEERPTRSKMVRFRLMGFVCLIGAALAASLALQRTTADEQAFADSTDSTDSTATV
jgi:hypothetical protein